MKVGKVIATKKLGPGCYTSEDINVIIREAFAAHDFSSTSSYACSLGHLRGTHTLKGNEGSISYKRKTKK